MKKTAKALTVILAMAGIFSCASTANTTGSAAAPPPPAGEERTLAQIYNQYEGVIVLTGAQTYTVVKGDTLSRIAREHYGTGDNPYYFPLIIAASKGGVDIVDPDSIEVGMQLIIPSLQENLNDPGARANLKNLLKDIADVYAVKPGAQSEGIHSGLTRLYNTL